MALTWEDLVVLGTYEGFIKDLKDFLLCDVPYLLWLRVPNQHRVIDLPPPSHLLRIIKVCEGGNYVVLEGFFSFWCGLSIKKEGIVLSHFSGCSSRIGKYPI